MITSIRTHGERAAGPLPPPFVRGGAPRDPPKLTRAVRRGRQIIPPVPVPVPTGAVPVRLSQPQITKHAGVDLNMPQK